MSSQRAAIAVSVGLLLSTVAAPALCQPEDASTPDAETAAVEPDPSLLEPVEHRTPGIREEEQAALAEILQLAHRTDPEKQGAVARRNVLRRRAEYVVPDDEAENEFSLLKDVLRHPELYEGRLVTVAGQMETIVKRSAEETPAGVEQLFEVWLTGAGSQVPVVVLCLTVPEGLPTGGGLSEPVTVTGYFFKLMTLPETQAARVAPLVVSATIDWQPIDTAQPGRLEEVVRDSVRHKVRGFTDAERYGYYRGLYYAQRVDEDARRQAAREWMHDRRQEFFRDPQHRGMQYSLIADLYNHYEEMPAGQAMTIDGYVRKHISYPAGKNAFGIETLHEAWIYTLDSQSFPVVVVFTENPDGLPEGEDINEPVRLTGYFFKMYVYDAEDNKTHFAPMFLAEQVEWTPENQSGVMTPWFLYAGIAVVGLAAIAYMLYAQRASRARPAATRAIIEPEPDFSALGAAEDVPRERRDETDPRERRPT